MLLNYGADVNARSGDGFTPLHFALNREVAEVLITKGADVNARSYSDITPLKAATQEGRKHVMELIREHGGGL